MASDEELNAIFKRISVRKDEQLFLFEVAGKNVFIPFFKNKEIVEDDVNNYLELAFFLDKVIEKFQQLVGQENFTFVSRLNINLTSRLSLFYSNKKYADFIKSQAALSRYKNSYPSSKKIHAAREAFTYFSIEYEEKDAFWAFIPDVEQSYSIFNLLQKSIEIKTPTSYREVIYAIDALQRGLDNLFIEKGLEVSAQNRANLLSLAFSFSKELQKDEKIQEFIKPEDPSNPLSDEKLIHAAAQGWHANIIKMFHLYDYYPSSVEEMKMLDSMPYDMLSTVLGSK